MKIWSVVLLAFGLAMTAMTALTAHAAPPAGAGVPTYNPATEAVFKGTVEEVRDRECPVSGGMGSHVVLKLDDGSSIEVHLASTKFVRMYDLVFVKGDRLEVTGSKVDFEGVSTIFAREVKRGNDVFVFRDKEGTPVW
jgi:DNA/RNA endonuclease YhcR with UshA esterase domain